MFGTLENLNLYRWYLVIQSQFQFFLMFLSVVLCSITVFNFLALYFQNLFVFGWSMLLILFNDDNWCVDMDYIVSCYRMNNFGNRLRLFCIKAWNQRSTGSAFRMYIVHIVGGVSVRKDLAYTHIKYTFRCSVLCYKVVGGKFCMFLPHR